MYNLDGKSYPRYRNDMEEIYAQTLAPYATKVPCENSRQHVDTTDEFENRSNFQRDRDRIIHSKAFRRLMYKTQVFVNHEGDHFRTRLTHTLEVSQFARGICKSMGLNEELAEAIALGHDLGHTPFGHAVESLLKKIYNDKMNRTFFHNENSVRMVDLIETRGKAYSGLNLTKEVREGILKHNEDRSGLYPSLFPNKPCSTLEGQVVGIVDTIAYICHDLQDGINSGLIEKAYCDNSDFKQGYLEIIDIISAILNKKIVLENFKKCDDTYFIRELIHQLILSITDASVDNLENYNIKNLDDVHFQVENNKILIKLKDEDITRFNNLKKLVYKYVYDLHTIQTMDMKAKEVATALFDTFFSNMQLLPPPVLYKYNHFDIPTGYEGITASTDDDKKVIIICDYIASMTDRFALEEHERIKNPRIKI